MLTKIKALLDDGQYTCVLSDGKSTHTSKERGVKPLVQFIEKDELPCGLFAADKVVGKATAYLYIKLKIHSLYAKVISEPAVKVLTEHGIDLEYDTLVPNIINRKGDGICPFEEALLSEDDAERAYTIILNKMKEMNIIF